MNLRTACIVCLCLTSSIPSFGCVAPTEEAADTSDESETGTASSALTATLGGVNINEACILQSGPQTFATLTQPASSPGAAYAWRCELTPSELYGIDLTTACRVQYVLPTAYANTTDPDNAYSWECLLSL